MTTTKKISELPSAVTPLSGDEDIPVVQNGATRRTSPADIVSGKADTVHTHTLSDIADAGTAAGANIGDFATAAQGTKADTALQPADVGSAAYNNTGDFATAVQGAKADSALQPDDLAYPGLLNAVINGGCLISHRGQKNLSTSWQYGPVDLLAVKAEGSVSAGTIRQFTGAYSLSMSGAALMVENATLTGAGAILFRHRIESRNARAFAGQPARFSARSYQDAGSTLDVIITIRKANAEDNFTSLTQIATGTVQLANDTNADLALAIADMGDCRNGIEIEVKINCGAVTTKDFFLGQLQLSIGTNIWPFEARPVSLEESLVQRYLRPAMLVSAVANSGSNMQAVLQHPGMRASPVYEVDAPIAMTDGYTADFTQSQASITNVHENTRHRGRVDIAYFSGLTSGRHYLHRGMGGLILASAEL